MKKYTLLWVSVFQIFFSLGFGAFEVSTVSPAQNSNQIDHSPTIVVEFNEIIDPATVDHNSIAAYGSQTGYVSYNSYNAIVNNNELTIDFSSTFFPGEIITIILHTISSSESQTILRPFSWSFTIAVDQGYSYFELDTSFFVESFAGIFDIKCADMDQDGSIDIITANEADNSLSIIYNFGNGIFLSPITIPVGISPMSVVISDFDKDSDMDIACVGSAGGEEGFVKIALNDGEDGFSLALTLSGGAEANSITVLDINNDGNLDLAVGNTADEFIIIYLNDGSLNFERHDITQNHHTQIGLTAGDFNNDGQFELVYARMEPSMLEVITQDSLGAFVSYGISDEHPYESINHTPGDFNNDGFLDLLINQNNETGTSVFQNNGESYLVYSSSFPGNQSTIGDYDSDGDIDILTNGSFLSLYLNDGSGNYNIRWNAFPPVSIQTLVSGDIDSDGDLDLILASGNSIYILDNCADDIPPPPPTNLSATTDLETIRLEWRAGNVFDDQLYAIYKSVNSSSDLSLADTVIAPLREYIDGSVEINSMYYYSVQSIDAWGNMSGFSDTIGISTNPPPVLPPINLVATTDLQGVYLEWDPASEEVDSYYVIHKSTNNELSLVPVDTILAPSTEYIDWSIEPDTVYYYAVQALDALLNQSDLSETISISTFLSILPHEMVGINFPISLIENYPNPFNNYTIFTINLGISTKLEMRIYDLQGREISTINKGLLNSGIHHIVVTLGNVPSGYYLVVFDTGEKINQSKKILLLR